MYRIRLTNERLPKTEGHGLLATAEGFYHADRILPFHVLIYVLEGVIHVTEDGHDYAVGSGEMLFLKSGFRHFGRRQIPRGTRWYYVHFALPQPEENIETEETSQLVLPKQLSGLAGGTLEAELAAFVENCRTRDETARWYLNQQLYVLLSHIAHYEQQPKAAPGLAERIARHLSRHTHEPFCAEELEKVFFLSYKHMAAVFKKSRSQTMQSYHHRLRMEEGARLLQETLLPVGEISEKLGFSDQLYFSRCFHRFAGLSPTAYRRKARDY